MNAGQTIFILSRDKFDLFLIERYLQYADVPNPLRVSGHAHEAACYFQGAGIYADRETYPEPGLLILDLQFPEQASFSLLEWLRANPAYRDIPIVATGIWKYSDEVERAHELGITAYFRIPAEVMSLTDFVHKLVSVEMAISK